MPVAPFTDLTHAASHGTSFNMNEIGFQFEELGGKMEAFINGAINVQALQMHVTNMHALLECLMTVRRQRDDMSSLNLLNRAVENIMEGVTHSTEHAELLKHYRDIHFRLLQWMQDSRAYGPLYTQRGDHKVYGRVPRRDSLQHGSR